ncbi:hypothetical protein QN277_015508 [Acacia crassicarpa]|uniref:Uncharacterized protein n=1 Tax=Acacia crassicarpa TaxID=499986 RepID=A0AAE1KKE4_9FABA|nr:hypothetical protein QN277_015508 [Acacia crassicarpa]
MGKVGDMEMISCRVNNGEICQCNELEERSVKAEARCAELELELQKKMEYCEALEAKLNSLEKEKFEMDDNLKSLSTAVEALKGIRLSGEREKKNDVVDLEEENDAEDKFFLLKVEIRVLEIEKRRAETEAQVWKERFKKLESQALESRLKSVNLDCHEENGKRDSVLVKPEEHSHLGTPPNETCWGNPSHGKAQLHRRARRRLELEYEQSPSNKMASCRPRGAKPTSSTLIYIIDSDDEPNTTQQPVLHNQYSGNISFSTHVAADEDKLSDNSLKGCFYGENNEDLNSGTDVQFSATCKRKRARNVVSDSESDDDDDVPISQQKRMQQFLKVGAHLVRHDSNQLVSVTSPMDDQANVTVTHRRRLVRHGKCAIKSQQDKKFSRGPCEDKHEQSIPLNEETNDDELEEDSSDNEEGSLGGFIVRDDDVSEDTSNKPHDASDSGVGFDSQDVSDEDLDFEDILSQIQRNKFPKRKWEFEGDMLAAFGKDPQLCMKAVCTLYRQQTSEERTMKGSLHYNDRGFNNVDAFRGSTLAEFITDGDPLGDVKKTVRELEEYDARGVETCRTMALRYSKQLFEIYKNKEDPLFP